MDAHEHHLRAGGKPLAITREEIQRKLERAVTALLAGTFAKMKLAQIDRLSIEADGLVVVQFSDGLVVGPVSLPAPAAA